MKHDFEFLFSEMTFEAAAKYFGEKMPYTKKAWKIFNENSRRSAFTISGYQSAEVVKEVYNKLLDAIEDGSTMEQFREEINTFLTDKGYEGLSPFRADNIFRTNVQTAFQVGHYESMTSPAVKKARPYWMYDAVGDERTRPSHMAMNGKVFPADSPVWDTWYPPNGYRCRCTVVTLSERQVKVRGLTISESVPKTVMVRGRRMDVSVDPNFNYNPAKKEWRLDMGDSPRAIREAYEERTGRKGKK